MSLQGKKCDNRIEREEVALALCHAYLFHSASLSLFFVFAPIVCHVRTSKAGLFIFLMLVKDHKFERKKLFDFLIAHLEAISCIPTTFPVAP